MDTKSKKDIGNMARSEQQLKKYIDENKEIAEVLEVLKETQDVRNLHPLTLDRFFYHSIE